MAFVQADGASIYYEALGSGPAVAFAHGAGGNAASWWQQVPVFSERYRMIMFDHRMYGRSQCAPENFDRGKFGEDLMVILDAEGIERTAIVCQSMGGWTGLRAALERPDRVSCLILSNTSGGVSTPLEMENIKIARERFASGGFGNVALYSGFIERHPDLAFLYAQISSLNAQLTPEVRKQMAGRDNPVTEESLSKLSVPTLLITSENDVVFPPAAIREVAALKPDAELVELPVAGHSLYFETPDAFNSTVGAFLEQHAR
jgi:3-oxoadipate enol-lactonase